MSIYVQIIGSSSATEANGRHQTAQVLKKDKFTCLIDCGDGTQSQLKRRKVNYQKINTIFISHLHGDHYLGLMGLISTMSLMGRKKPLKIFAPYPLKEIINVQCRHSGTELNYQIEFVPTNDQELTLLTETESLKIYSFPLDHGIPCTGFLFQEKENLRKLLIEKIPSGVDSKLLRNLKEGKNIQLKDGTEINYTEVTKEAPPPSSYAYCSDTAFSDKTIEFVKGSTLLYHESTFLDQHKDRATKTFHSTAKEAATVALKANVSKLLMGHFSARYRDLSQFEEEAKEIFPASETVHEGIVYKT